MGREGSAAPLIQHIPHPRCQSPRTESKASYSKRSPSFPNRHRDELIPARFPGKGSQRKLLSAPDWEPLGSSYKWVNRSGSFGVGKSQGSFLRCRRRWRGLLWGGDFVSSPEPAQVRVHPTPRCVQEEQQPEKLLPLLLGTDSRLRRGLIQQQRQL